MLQFPATVALRGQMNDPESHFPMAIVGFDTVPRQGTGRAARIECFDNCRCLSPRKPVQDAA